MIKSLINNGRCVKETSLNIHNKVLPCFGASLQFFDRGVVQKALSCLSTSLRMTFWTKLSKTSPTAETVVLAVTETLNTDSLICPLLKLSAASYSPETNPYLLLPEQRTSENLSVLLHGPNTTYRLCAFHTGGGGIYCAKVSVFRISSFVLSYCFILCVCVCDFQVSHLVNYSPVFLSLFSPSNPVLSIV